MPLQKGTASRRVTVIFSALLVAVSLSLTGCSFQSLIPNHQNPFGDTPTIRPEEQDKNTSPDTNGDKEEPKEELPPTPSYKNPLTGLTVMTDMSSVRPVALSFGNSGKAPIQHGIGDADILIEAPIETGETRLIGISNRYTSLSEIGGIRPSRPYLLDFANVFSAVTVCDGDNDIHPTSGSYPTYSLIDHRRDGLTTVFYHASGYATPSDLFTSGTRLLGALEGFDKKGPTLPFTFAADNAPTVLFSGTASGVVIPFSSSQVTQFSYDRASGTYLRRQNSFPHLDSGTGKQLAYTNILVLSLESATSNKVTGSELSLDTESGGRGFFLTGGAYQEIAWSRTPGGELHFTDVAGNPLVLNQGKTYIGMVDIRVSDSVLIVN